MSLKCLCRMKSKGICCTRGQDHSGWLCLLWIGLTFQALPTADSVQCLARDGSVAITKLAGKVDSPSHGAVGLCVFLYG